MAPRRLSETTAGIADAACHSGVVPVNPTCCGMSCLTVRLDPRANIV